MKTIFAVTCLLITQLLIGQDMRLYYAHTEKAISHFENKNYAESSKNFEIAFNSVGGKATPDHRYQAARAFAFAKNEEKSFYHLFYLAEHKLTKFHNLNQIMEDMAFADLKNLEKWQNLIDIIKANKAAYEEFLDKPLAEELERIHDLDQKYRAQFVEAEKKYGFKSEEAGKIMKLMNDTDNKNRKRVLEILDERGWLGPKIVGNKGNQALFYVIQHSPHEIMKKYLPMMQEAVKKGDALATSVALMEDRVDIADGKKQKYGSQIGRDPDTGAYFVKPVLYPEHINEIRKSIGLPTIEEYVSQWDITWDIETHKENTKKYEARQKKKDE